MTQFVKLVVFVPSTHADVVRKALGDAGAGKIGNYSHCTFTVIGKGRYMPQAGAHPYVGKVGEVTTVEEERIETVCETEKVKDIIDAIKNAHPYEEMAYDVYSLISEDELS